MSTFAEISGYAFILCLVLWAMEYFTRLFDKRGLRSNLPDFILLLAVWAGYVWLSNLFSTRIIQVDEYDIVNLLAIALVCVSVLLFGGRNDHSFYP